MQQFLLHGQAGRLAAGIQAANELLRVTEGYWILITFTARRRVIDYLQQSRALVSPVAELFGLFISQELKPVDKFFFF